MQQGIRFPTSPNLKNRLLFATSISSDLKKVLRLLSKACESGDSDTISLLITILMSRGCHSQIFYGGVGFFFYMC